MSLKRLGKVFTVIKTMSWKAIGKVFVIIILVVLIIAISVTIFRLLGIYIHKFAIAYTIKTEYDLFKDLLTVILTIAGLAIAAGGYLVFQVLSTKIEKQALSAAETKRWRALATFFVHDGFNQWVLYKNTSNKEYLDRAIDATETAYEFYASRLDQRRRENELIICTIRNNLACYYAERQLPEDKKIARDYAKYVYERIKKFPRSRTQWEETYNFVKTKYP